MPQLGTKQIIADLPDGRSVWVTVPINASKEEKQRIAAQQILQMQQPAPQVQSTQPKPANVDNGTIKATPNDFLSQAIARLRNILPASSTFLINALPQSTEPHEVVAKAAPLIETGGGLAAAAGATALGQPELAGPAASFAMPAIGEAIRAYMGEAPSQTMLLPQMGSLGPILEKGTMNEIGGKIAGVVGKGIVGAKMTPSELAANTGTSESAIRLGGTTGQLLGKDSTLGKAASFTEDILGRGAKLASKDETSINITNAIKSGTQGAQPIHNITDKAIEDLLENDVKLGRFFQNGQVNINGRVITANNGRRDLQGAFLDKLFRDSTEITDLTDLSKVDLNVDKLVNNFGQMLRKQEKFVNPLFSTQQINNLNEFFQAAKQMTEVGHPLGAYFSLNMTRQALSLGGLLLAGKVAGIASPTTILGGYVGFSALAKLLTNRAAAPIILNMVKGRPLGMSAQAASRLVMNALSRTPITIDTTEGQKEGVIDNNGNVQSIDKFLQMQQ